MSKQTPTTSVYRHAPYHHSENRAKEHQWKEIKLTRGLVKVHRNEKSVKVNQHMFCFRSIEIRQVKH